MSAGARRGRPELLGRQRLRTAQLREQDVAGGEYRAATSTAAGVAQLPAAARWPRAAVTSSPSVPAPTTATTSRARCDRGPEDHVHGAGDGLNSDRVLVGELHRAQRPSWVECAPVPAVDQPPPVSAQKPVWSPRAGCARRRCSHSCPRDRLGRRGTAGRSLEPHSREPAATPPGFRRKGGRPALRLHLRQECRPPRDPARRGTRRCPRSHARCARPAWRGPIRRCRKGRG